MKTISVSKLKAHLSAELAKVRKGGEFIITDHEKPIAVVKPFIVDDDLVLIPAKKSAKGFKIEHDRKIDFDGLKYMMADRKR